MSIVVQNSRDSVKTYPRADINSNNNPVMMDITIFVQPKRINIKKLGNPVIKIHKVTLITD